MDVEKYIVNIFKPLENSSFLSPIDLDATIEQCSREQRIRLSLFAEANVSYILMMCDYYDEYYIPISSLAEKIGIKVFTDEMGDNGTSALFMFESERKIILLNSKDSIARQRLTTACILGMYLFEYSHIKERVVGSFNLDERMLHNRMMSIRDYYYLIFAVYLLIPEEKFKAIIDKMKKVMDSDDIRELLPVLTKKYGVPREAMNLRLELMLLGDRHDR